MGRSIACGRCDVAMTYDPLTGFLAEDGSWACPAGGDTDGHAPADPIDPTTEQEQQ